MAATTPPPSTPRGADDMQTSTPRAFQAYGRRINSVTSFKYLDRIMMELDDDWMVVVGNINKERNSWAQLSRILGIEGVKPTVLEILLKTVEQVEIIFGL